MFPISANPVGKRLTDKSIPCNIHLSEHIRILPLIRCRHGPDNCLHVCCFFVHSVHKIIQSNSHSRHCVPNGINESSDIRSKSLSKTVLNALCSRLHKSHRACQVIQHSVCHALCCSVSIVNCFTQLVVILFTGVDDRQHAGHSFFSENCTSRRCLFSLRKSSQAAAQVIHDAFQCFHVSGAVGQADSVLLHSCCHAVSRCCHVRQGSL